MTPELELLNHDFMAVRFPYDANAVERIKNLQNRKWDAKKKQWEVHVAHLPQVLGILNMNRTMATPAVLEYFDAHWRDLDLRLTLGNSVSILNGANAPIKAIEDATSFWVEGAEHSNQYKLGHWDGFKRLMSRRSRHPTYPTGLHQRVVEILDRSRTRYEILDSRPESKPSLAFKTSNRYALYDYQSWSVDRAIEAKRGIMHMATGSGKTIVAAHIIARLCRPTVFFVHTKDLLYQTRDRLAEVLGVPIGQIGDNIIDPAPVTVATIQTVSQSYGQKYEKFDEEDWDDETDVSSEERRQLIQRTVEGAEVVFFDECHHVASSTFYFVALKMDLAGYRYGLSATPYRTDKQDLMIEAALAPRIVKVDSSFLIERKFLVKPQIRFLTMPAGVSLPGRVEYAKVYTAEVVENDRRNQLIAATAKKEVAAGRTVLILVQQIRHGQRLQELLPGSEFVQGSDSTDYRTACLEGLRQRQLKILIATTLADEGLDLPSLDCLILAGAGKSETRALQRIGRVLRRAEGKQCAVVYDFWDEARFLQEHAKKRMEIYQTEEQFAVEIDSSHLQGGKKGARLFK